MSLGAFPRCLPFTLHFEGAYSNDRRDPGGATYRGVTQRTYNAFRIGKGLRVRDVRLIDEGELEAIYKGGYWDPVGCEKLPAGVDLLAFDIAVNMGPHRAAEFLSDTIKLPVLARIQRLDALRCGFWRLLRTFPVFGKGWLARENACKALALRMAAAAANGGQTA